MKIIGLSGKKQAGKDTVASIILSLSETPCAKYGFANPLKLEVARALNITVDELEDNKEKYRLLLQWWGTEYRRDMFGQDYWIRKMRMAIEQFEERGCKLLVIPDVRFFNEYYFLHHEHEAPIYRIERSILDGEHDSHQSETELNTAEFKAIIQNNSTIQDLATAVKRTIKL